MSLCMGSWSTVSVVVPNGNCLVQCSSVEEFDELLGGLMHSRGEEGEDRAGSYQQHSLKFVFHTMDGREEELCSRGSQRDIT